MGGAGTADAEFWANTCGNIPETADFISLSNGTMTDHFRPLPGQTYCAMLQSRSKHTWWDGSKWVVPAYSADESGHLGGSAQNWPKNNVAGDAREYLPFWGSDGWARGQGGCCGAGSSSGWNMRFEILFVFACTHCGAGKYSTQAAQTSDVCINCAAGKFGETSRASSTEGEDIQQK